MQNITISDIVNAYADAAKYDIEALTLSLCSEYYDRTGQHEKADQYNDWACMRGEQAYGIGLAAGDFFDEHEAACLKSAR